MRTVLLNLLNGLLVLALLGPALPAPTAAAPGESGVYTEDFSTYTAKDYTGNTEWDIWNEHLTVSLSDATEQKYPAIALDGYGGVFVVWEDSRNSDNDIYIQRLDTNGNRLWQYDQRVNSDAGAAIQDSPDVAVGTNGNAVVVWEDSRDGNFNIYAQKIDSSGNKLWPTDVRINSDTGMMNQYSPTAAIDGSGNIVVMWQDYRNGNADIYAQKLDASGNKLWPSDVRVNSDAGAAFQAAPDVAISGGAVIAVWKDYRDGHCDIYAQKLSASGNKQWAFDAQVNVVGWQDDTQSSVPSLAVDGSGNAFVVWHASHSGEVDVYAQKLNASGNRVWSDDVRINFPNVLRDTHPSVGVDVNGNAVIVWEGSANICAQRLDGNGNKLWGSVFASADPEAAYQFDPVVVVEGNGSAFVAWRGYATGSNDIFVQRLDADGDLRWTLDVPVNARSGAASQNSPAIAVDNSESVFVIWADSRGGDSDIYAQRFDVNGNKLWAADVRVNSDTRTANQYSPSAWIDRSGNVIIVWNDNRSGNWDIYAERLDTNGNKMWIADVRVNSDDGTADQRGPAVAVDGSGNAVVVWNDMRNGDYDVYAQRLNINGHKLWSTDVRVNSDSEAVSQWSPDVAVNSSGQAFIVWEDQRGNMSNVYAQKLGTSGSKLWGDDLQVNSVSSIIDLFYSPLPTVAVDSGGNAIVAWIHKSGADYDAYAQKLDTNGSRLWVADVHTSSDSSGSHGCPDVAVDGSGNAVVVWDDWRWGNIDIYAQQLNPSGSKMWVSDVRVNTDSGEAHQYFPSVATSDVGDVFVAWEDERIGNADIFIQRLGANGTPAWISDVQVVYPDLFYLPTGTAQSRTVDTIAGNITQATLTADYALNGGSVQFYLTNDGGAHWAAVIPDVTHVFTTTGSDLRWRAVLTGDPVWRNRTPVVNSLRIEYSTQVPYADDYEPDDTCAQARPIGVNGAAQAHTFHQQADADWVWFDVISGTTYIVQTSNTQANADTTLELRAACPQPPLASDDNAFGREARLTWQATFSGPVYVKVANHTPSLYGPDTGYDLSVRTFTRPPVAVIVAGHNDSYSLQANIDHAADMAYRAFLNTGTPKANIRYFAPNPARDVDGNGLNDDIFATATITGVRDAVQDWARTRGVGLGVPFITRHHRRSAWIGPVPA